ncbi:MAG: hypothetical protein HN742_27020 [Lentisphaerae bacterium]|jgi:hypothetical protein|nr:hypothetical protein [Lentisphaerota bacterium]MBT4821202.1 hypothetical protein [Lentisphaerota bacterium]MBT5607886.1 hypothetical protein [Lentisphaerota bacterium]MBT7061834.1 hypothetical protein [Lentisphaerota bacterium]MBT7845555.1 hypothetical protein [Lentisphaerota bacterium]
MTIRAAILGLLASVFVCCYTYFNDAIIHQTMFVGNTMPISVYGGLILFVLALNPLLTKLRRVRPLSATELVVILSMTLAACSIPGSGLMRTFTSTLMMPHHYARTSPGWTTQGVLESVPRRMLADVSVDEDRGLNGFVQGLGTGDAHIAPAAVPWAVWRDCLAFWVPLIVTLWVCLLGLSIVVHRQWADHERLPYPIAAFASALLPSSDKKLPAILRSRIFWLGALPIVLLHLNNYACQILPGKLIPIRTSFDLWALRPLFDPIARGGGWFFFRPRIYFTAIAFAYFLATDVSLSLGIGPILYAFIVGKLRDVGISLTGGGFFAPKPQTFLGFGAYLGMLLSITYTGRNYFMAVARRIIGIKAGDDVQPTVIWAGRLSIAAFFLMVAQLAIVGLEWPFALLYSAGIVTVFLIMSRVIAETGLFFIQAWWFPGVILAGLFGPVAVGPQAMLIMLLLTTVLALDTREALMPFMVNSLKLLDTQKLHLGKGATFCGIALLVSLLAVIPFVLYLQYDLGVDLADRWANVNVPTFAFNQTVSMKQKLEAQGALSSAMSAHGFERFGRTAPKLDVAISAIAGLVLVLVVSAGRLRFAHWPLHPILFLIWHTYPGKAFAASFLIGWFIKRTITKYGGARLYQDLKPLMFGLIAGDMLGGIIPIVIGAIYYLITGELPVKFSIMPG